MMIEKEKENVVKGVVVMRGDEEGSVRVDVKMMMVIMFLQQETEYEILPVTWDRRCV